MIERPILFSGPMVRALLDGQKTQTRRVMKPQPDFYDPAGGFPLGGGRTTSVSWKENHVEPETLRVMSPYGRPGDRLWVREAFTRVPASAYRMSEGVQQTVNPGDPYEAAIYAAGWDRSIPKWKPSIHMPRWASRILLEITDVRVERLNDCSEADALAEGSQHPSLVPLVGVGWSSRDMYARLWEHINGAGSWAANPWVWVVEFKRVQP